MAIIIPKNELNEFSLPRVCVASGQPGQVTFQKVQFQYFPKWIAIFAIAPLIYLIFFFLLRKTASGKLPFSEQAWSEVKVARRNTLFAVLALIGGVVLSGVLSVQLGDLGLLLILMSVVGGIIALAVTSRRMRKVYPFVTLIDDQAVTLTLPSPEAERLMAAHLSAGARVPS